MKTANNFCFCFTLDLVFFCYKIYSVNFTLICLNPVLFALSFLTPPLLLSFSSSFSLSCFTYISIYYIVLTNLFNRLFCKCLSSLNFYECFAFFHFYNLNEWRSWIKAMKKAGASTLFFFYPIGFECECWLIPSTQSIIWLYRHHALANPPTHIFFRAKHTHSWLTVRACISLKRKFTFMTIE